MVEIQCYINFLVFVCKLCKNMAQCPNTIFSLCMCLQPVDYALLIFDHSQNDQGYKKGTLCLLSKDATAYLQIYSSKVPRQFGISLKRKVIKEVNRNRCKDWHPPYHVFINRNEFRHWSSLNGARLWSMDQAFLKGFGPKKRQEYV